jgi:N-acetylglutamate synthase-like GNAT family acetyltransferase
LRYIIRDYEPADETAWLRCRALSFLDTAFFDAVERTKPRIAAPGAELVAATETGELVGMLDFAIEGATATIETIAVHPDGRSQGIGRALLEAARARALALGATTLDAWTRDDPGTLHWFRANGFSESDHYLHVYADLYTDAEEPDRAIAERRPGLRPVKVFLHATLEHEASFREQFARVHVCRRFSSELDQ